MPYRSVSVQVLRPPPGRAPNTRSRWGDHNLQSDEGKSCYLSDPEDAMLPIAYFYAIPNINEALCVTMGVLLVV